MKKIIAISVMLVLIAGAAFADTSVGGNLKIGATLLEGGGGKDDVEAGNAYINDAYTNVTWAGDNAGGMMRLHSGGVAGSNSNVASWIPNAYVFWWWKPIEQLRIQLGDNADKDWGHAQITGWGYNAEAQGFVAVDKDTRGGLGFGNLARAGAWWGGFGDQKLGLALSIYPTDTIEIDLGVPMTGSNVASVTYANTDINFKVGIPDIGDVRLAVDLNKANKDSDQLVDVYLAFNVIAVENMGIEVGAAFKSGTDDSGKEASFQRIQAGLGYRLTADDLTFKARVALLLPDAAGQLERHNGDYAFYPTTKDSMVVAVGILPSYKLDAFTFYFNAGFGLDLNNSEALDWVVNPYIRVPANAGSFYAGFELHQLKSQGATEASWATTIGWNVYF